VPMGWSVRMVPVEGNWGDWAEVMGMFSTNF